MVNGKVGEIRAVGNDWIKPIRYSEMRLNRGFLLGSRGGYWGKGTGYDESCGQGCGLEHPLPPGARHQDLSIVRGMPSAAIRPRI